MAIVLFSVSEDVKQAFNETFEGQDKNAVIANLMREAVRRRRQSQAAVRDILERRRDRRFVSDEEILSARREGRP